MQTRRNFVKVKRFLHLKILQNFTVWTRQHDPRHFYNKKTTKKVFLLDSQHVITIFNFGVWG